MGFWEQLTVVLIGVLAASSGYLIKTFTLEPLLTYRKTEGAIRNKLKYFARTIITLEPNSSRAEEVSEICRQLSSDLEESYYSIGLRKRLVAMEKVPSETEVQVAAKRLIYLANNIRKGESDKNYDAAQDIWDALHFGGKL